MAKSTDEIKTKQNRQQAPETEQSVVNAIEKKLEALYTKQKLDTQTDKIRIIRGELPLEVQDLEDELAGLQTRLNKYSEEMEAIDKILPISKTSSKRAANSSKSMKSSR
ncbi:MAG: hypothetical protein U5L09_10145 [Bacteroidales bacterium]|nr:hypothetical protein [Bacteroidales bacterium]